MNIAEIVDDLGDHGFTDTSADTKLRVIQDTIWEIEGLHPWPFLDASVNLTFDGTSSLATNWPADFRAAVKMTTQGNGRGLTPIHIGDLEEHAGAQITQVAAPQVFYYIGEQLHLWPVPPAGTVVRMRYLRWSPPITTDSPESAILLPKRHHRLIVLGSLIRLYDMEDDPELAVRFQEHFDARVGKVLEDLFQKQYDRPDHIRVTDPDSWAYDI